MIIRHETSDLLLVAQPDHAALAERIMREWRADGFPRLLRRGVILEAIAAHDNGWLEPDASPIVDETAGSLLDFIHAPVAVRQGVWPRGTDRLGASPYQAALVAEHAIRIFDRFHADPGWRPFFDDMRRRRSTFLERAGQSLDALSHDYMFVRIGDLVSLAFCNGWTDEQRFGSYRMRLTGNQVSIVPDPFDGAELAFSVRAKRLPDRRYTAASARTAYRLPPKKFSPVSPLDAWGDDNLPARLSRLRVNGPERGSHANARTRYPLRDPAARAGARICRNRPADPRNRDRR